MAEYTNNGVVTEVSRKEWYDDRKKATINLYSFRIEGTGKWFRTGTNAPTFQQGEHISFVNDEKNNVKLDTVTRGAAAPQQPSAGVAVAAPTTQAAPTGGNTSGGAQTRSGYWDAKEERDLEKDAYFRAKDDRYEAVAVPRMTYGNAVSSAVALVAAAVANDCLPIGNMTKGKQLDYLQDCVSQVADKFFLESMRSHERLAILEQEAFLDAEEVVEEPAAPAQEIINE